MTSWRDMPQFPWDEEPDTGKPPASVCRGCKRLELVSQMRRCAPDVYVCTKCDVVMSEAGFGRQKPVCPNCGEPSGLAPGELCDRCDYEISNALDCRFDEVAGG